MLAGLEAHEKLPRLIIEPIILSGLVKPSSMVSSCLARCSESRATGSGPMTLAKLGSRNCSSPEPKLWFSTMTKLLEKSEAESADCSRREGLAEAAEPLSALWQYVLT
jgi:hypothetical protein